MAERITGNILTDWTAGTAGGTAGTAVMCGTYETERTTVTVGIAWIAETAWIAEQLG